MRSLDKTQERKYKARRAVKAALLQGRIKKRPCTACGNKASESQAHHTDYKQPLKVIWLCEDCHKKLHYNPGKGTRILIKEM